MKNTLKYLSSLVISFMMFMVIGIQSDAATDTIISITQVSATENTASIKIERTNNSTVNKYVELTVIKGTASIVYDVDTSKNYTIKGLSPTSNYQIKARLYTKAGTSKIFEGETKTIDIVTKPSKVKNLVQYYNTTETNIIGLNWYKQSPTFYNVEYTYNGTTHERKYSEVGAEGITIKVPNGTRVTAKVQAVMQSKAGFMVSGEYSDVGTFNTLPLINNNITIENIGNIYKPEFRINYRNTAADNIDGYELKITDMTNGKEIINKQLSKDNFMGVCTLSNSQLTFGHSYSVTCIPYLNTYNNNLEVKRKFGVNKGHLVVDGRDTDRIKVDIPVPNGVSSLRQIGYDNNGVTIDWKPSETDKNIDSLVKYEVKFNSKTSITKSTSITIPNSQLEDYTSTVSVRPFIQVESNKVYGASSKVVVVKVPKNPVYNLKQTGINTIQWDAVEGATDYLVRVVGKNITTRTTETTFINIDSELTPGATCYVEVTAQNKRENIIASQQLTRLPLRTNINSVPENITISSGTENNKLLLKYDRKNTLADGYELEVYNADTNELLKKYTGNYTNASVNTSDTITIDNYNDVDNLILHIRYFSNYWINKNGLDSSIEPLGEQYKVYGDWSNFIRFTNIKFNKIDNIKQSEYLTNAINLTWDKQDRTKIYEVQISKDKGNDKKWETFKQSSNNTTISDLDSGEIYYVRIRATNGEIVGDYSDIIETFTKPNTKVSNLKQIESTKDSATIQWDLVKEAQGYIIKYVNMTTGQIETLAETESNKYKINLKDSDTLVVYVYTMLQSEDKKITIESNVYDTIVVKRAHEEEIEKPEQPSIKLSSTVKGLKINKITPKSKSITISYNKDTIADGYVIELWDATKNKLIKTINTKNNNNIKINNSYIGKNTLLKIRARTYVEINGEKKFSKYNNWKYFMGKGIKSKVTSKKISWVKPAGIKRYTIYNKGKKICTTKSNYITKKQFNKAYKKVFKKNPTTKQLKSLTIKPQIKVGKKYVTIEIGK